MAVVDLDYMELLEDTTVKSHLVILELGHDLATEVDKKDISELLLGFEITLIPLNIGLDLVNIVSALEHGAHSLLSGLNVADVRLALGDLLDESVDASLHIFALIEGNIESVQIIDLTLDPMVEIGEGVSEVLRSVLQALKEVAILGVVEDERVGVLVRVIGQIGILVGTEGLRRSGVRLDKHLLLGQVARHVIFELREERLGLLDVGGELGELSVEGSSIMISHLVNLGVCSFLQALEELRGGHLHELREGLLNVEALWAAKELELFRVDDEVVLAELAEEALQVEATLLQEDDVLVAHGLLGRALRQNDARPPLDQSVIQGVELVVATLALPLTLKIASPDHIDDVTMEVLRISHRELKHVGLIEDVM